MQDGRDGLERILTYLDDEAKVSNVNGTEGKQLRSIVMEVCNTGSEIIQNTMLGEREERRIS